MTPSETPPIALWPSHGPQRLLRLLLNDRLGQREITVDFQPGVDAALIVAAVLPSGEVKSLGVGSLHLSIDGLDLTPLCR